MLDSHFNAIPKSVLVIDQRMMLILYCFSDQRGGGGGCNVIDFSCQLFSFCEIYRNDPKFSDR